MKSAHLKADGKVLPSNTTLHPPGAANFSHADAWGLPIEMRKRVKGEVRFDDGSRALYATDGSNYRQTPIGVVLPKSKDDVIGAIEVAGKFGAPITDAAAGRVSRSATLPMKELEAIAATRFVFGVRVALLLSHFLTSRQRHWAGWTLAIVGALSTPPLIYDVYAPPAPTTESHEN